MTEKSCNYMGRYFVFLLRKMKGCIILSTVFAFIGIPVATTWSGHAGYGITDAVITSLYLIGILGTCVMSFVCPLVAMKHLHSRNTADNILSLPIKAWQRYICDVAVSLLSYALPFIVFALPSVLIFERNSESTLMTVVLLFLCLLMFSMLNIFLSCLCGRTAEAIMYPIAFNIILPIFTYFAHTLSRANIYGLSWDAGSYSPSLETIFGWTSPVGCFMYYMMLNFYNWGRAVIPALIFMALFFALGMLAYTKRPAYNIGKPFVFGKAYAANSVLLALMCVISYLAVLVSNVPSYSDQAVAKRTNPLMRGENFPAIMLLGGLLFALMLVMELINYKKVKNIFKFLIKYAAVFAAGYFISVGLFASEGFGESNIVPSASETAYIMVSADFTDKSKPIGVSPSTSMISLDIEGDSELADYIRDVQRGVIKERSFGGNTYFHITYTLKNGNHIIRSYLGCTLPEDFTERIVNSEDYRLSAITAIERAEFEYNNVNKGELETVVYAANFAPNGMRIEDVNNASDVYFEGTADCDEIVAALKTDLRADMNYGRHTDMPLCNLMLGYIENREDMDYETGGYSVQQQFFAGTDRITIYENYTNTLSCISKYCTLPTVEQITQDFINETPVVTLIRWKKDDNGQNVRHLYTYYFITTSNIESYSPETVLLSPDEAAKLLKYSADSVSADGQEYYYALYSGLAMLGFSGEAFDESGRLTEKAKELLDKAGVLDSASFVADEDGNMSFSQNVMFRYVLNEQCYGELEKYFTDGRYVFTSDDIYGNEEPQDEETPEPSMMYNADGTMLEITTTRMEPKPVEQ